MDARLLAEMLCFVEKKRRGLGSIVIARNGYVVTETYFAPFTQHTRRHVYSVTKSIIAALIGIAIKEGAIDDVHQRVLDFFPEIADADRDPRLGTMTIEHLLEMRTGLDWNETTSPYETPRNAVSKMKSSPDWIRYFFDQPLAATPGRKFAYNSGASHVLSAIIQRRSGMPASAYAQKRLFDPLGITEVQWTHDPNGITTGGWGLHLSASEMAKFGHLLLNHGRWSGMQIVPAEWICESATKRAVVISRWDVRFRLAVLWWWMLARDSLPLTRMDYGYHWWLPPFGGYAALGYGGQAIFVLPACNLVVVTTGELASKEAYLPEKLVRSFIIPAVREV